jgi:hypothetical protein
MPLLSASFRESKWTDQEIGIAIARKKVIVPLSLDLTPYGFIAKYQAIRVKQSRMPETVWAVVKKLSGHRIFGSRIRAFLLDALAQSRSFDEAAKRAQRVSEIKELSPDELNRIALDSTKNDQVFHGFDARSIIGKLIDANETRMDKFAVRLFRKTVKDNW